MSAGGGRPEFEDLWAVLRRQQGRANGLRELFERTMIPMVWLDGDMRYLDANPASRLFLRRTLDELRGTTVRQFVPPDQMARLEELWARFVREGTIVATIRIHPPDGAELVADVSAVANMLPGAHLVVWMPAEWSAEELPVVVDDSERPAGRLTGREREVMRLLAMGCGVEQIATDLSLSPATVKTHVRNALRRLNARNRAHALAIALRQGEIGLE